MMMMSASCSAVVACTLLVCARPGSDLSQRGVASIVSIVSVVSIVDHSLPSRLGSGVVQ